MPMITLQSLEPREAHFCLKIEKLIQARFPDIKGKSLLLAISGGADSTALALLMHIIGKRLDLELNAFHLDHGLRPSAAEDAGFAQSLCEKLGIPCIIAKANIYKESALMQCGLEEAGRVVRYRTLRKYARKLKADYIVTAHHAGDLTEDVIMRLLRGAAWPALGGLQWHRHDIIRPFLHEDPRSLRNFAKACGQTWREDETNGDLAYKRNRVRHLILPLMRCENASLEKACIKIHNQAQLDRDYWQKSIADALKRAPWQFGENNKEKYLILSRELLAPLHPALRTRIYGHALSWLRTRLSLSGQNRAEIIGEIEKIYNSKTGGKVIECSGGISAVYRQGEITFVCHPRTPEVD